MWLGVSELEDSPAVIPPAFCFDNIEGFGLEETLKISHTNILDTIIVNDAPQLITFFLLQAFHNIKCYHDSFKEENSV